MHYCFSTDTLLAALDRVDFGLRPWPGSQYTLCINNKVSLILPMQLCFIPYSCV
jgi:hypothetical protein